LNLTLNKPLRPIVVSLGGVLGTKVSPPFFKEGWPDHKII